MAGLTGATGRRVSWPVLGGHPLSVPGCVGMVFQGPSLIGSLTAVENVGFALLLAGTDPAEAEQRSLAALARFGIEKLADRLPQQLSGGQAQRVAVARALAARPAADPRRRTDRAAGPADCGQVVRPATPGRGREAAPAW